MDEVAIVEEAVELLPQVTKLAHAAILADPQMAGLTVAQAKAISLLYHYGEQTMTAVAVGLGISLPSASELIDRLVERGLIERTHDPDDRRRVLVGLTPYALSFATRLHDLRRAQVRRALQLIPVEEWPAFIRSLRALATALAEERTVEPVSSNEGALAR